MGRWAADRPLLDRARRTGNGPVRWRQPQDRRHPGGIRRDVPGRSARRTGNVFACNEYPERHIDVRDDEGETWRIMYSLDGLPYPALRARVGSRVRFRFDATFHSGKVASFVLLDAAGPVLEIAAVVGGPRYVDETHISIGWGRAVGYRPTGCGGTHVARALRVVGDSPLSVSPRREGSVVLRGTRFRFRNVQSVAVTGARCLHDDDWMSWLLWRE